MAWSPAPQVQVARDAADAMERAAGTRIDRCIVLYTTADGALGYASFGRTRALCASARKVADAAYEHVMERWEEIGP
ncbi:MAG TPA: hypothetical protein PKC43_06390 [Phycisphaerales bacterium]|nr:hypothetical protein [Phycisphaerales bacterium]HMP37061.1 hypothetical protein [Phycisphaerales bacterium]